MRVPVLFAFAIATPLTAQALAVPPERAAGTALMQCVAHASGQGSIEKANAEVLARNGLVFSDAPPAFLSSTKSTPYGKAQYAYAPSAEGQVWAVGYDGGTCLVFALGTPVAPIEKRLTELFSIPGAWQAETAATPSAGERKLQYGWTIRPKQKLTALVSLRELAGEAKGFTMVTIGQTKE